MKMRFNAFQGFTTFFTLSLLMGLAPLPSDAEDYSHTTNNGTITITRYLGPGGAVVIPSTINGLPVTRIGNSAFFNCTTLSSVDIPNTVTDIGDHAFYFCSDLTNLNLPNSVTNISDGAFMHCGLTGIIIPTNVQSIGDSAFASCPALASATLPASVTTLGSALFYGCGGLVAITVDPDNPFYSSVEGLLFNKDQTTLVIWPQGKSQSCTIPDSVTTIGGHAFYECAGLISVNIPNTVSNIEVAAFGGCRSLSAVTLPNSVTILGEGAFNRCDSLRGITVPASVIDIGDGAFSACVQLRAISVDPLNPNYSSLNGVLFDKGQTVLMQYPGAKTGNYDIPTTVRTLGDSAFCGCGDLTAVSIPDGVTVIPIQAFASCRHLTSIALPAGLTMVAYRAICYCTSLKSITLPSRVTNIAGSAFEGCYSLTSVYFAGDAPSAGAYSFDGAHSAIVYYLPGKTGWGTTFAGLPAVLWNPLVQTGDPTFGPGSGGFGLPLTGTPDIPIVLEASTSPQGPGWVALLSCTLTNGSIYFCDTQSPNYASRFYRIRSP